MAGYRKIGMSSPLPPAANETTNRGGQYPVVDSSPPSSVAMAVVTVSSLVVLIALVVLVVILQRKRIREERLNRNRTVESVEGNDNGKGGDQEAAQSAEGKWSSGTVDLVVMAGETTPTFVAHPVPAPFTSNHVIECPPLVT